MSVFKFNHWILIGHKQRKVRKTKPTTTSSIYHMIMIIFISKTNRIHYRI